LFSYHIAEEISERRLQILLRKDEYPPLPVQLLAPEGRFAVPKVRAFVDFAAPRLKKYFARLSSEANRNASAIRSPRGRWLPNSGHSLRQGIALLCPSSTR
jgi:hypothetical protein